MLGIRISHTAHCFKIVQQAASWKTSHKKKKKKKIKKKKKLLQFQQGEYMGGMKIE